MTDEPSRLLTGNIYYRGGYISIAEYRNIITARSLYNLDNEYENTNLFSLNNKNNVASSISTVLNVIPQYNRMQVNTNLLGNVYDAFRDEGSALAKIGLIMLGKQMAYNSAMNLSVKYLPSINLSQALKGGKIFKLNEENTITIKNKEDQTFLDKVGNTASNFLGIDTYDVFGNANPFSKSSTNIDYIKNTGSAQLTHFYQAINLNIYKPINYQSNSDFSKTFVEYGEIAGVTIDSTRGSILRKQPTFTFDKANFHQYLGIKINPSAIDLANNAMNLSYSTNTDNIQEYAPTKKYVLDNFGTTKQQRESGLEDYVDSILGILNNDKENNLVWGRDGVDTIAKSEIEKYRGDEDTNLNNTEESGFGIKTGLLEYTRNLLNATSGQFVDITRKAFKKNNNIIGFQGSPLWKGNDSTYSTASGNANKTGVRQHTILDQYGNDSKELDGTLGFAKSIRFKGNIVYGNTNSGNENSVIYNRVLPRIHPTKKDNGVDSTNLMFTIENLAIGAIKRDKFGIIDDEYGTPIPLSEVGPFAGRQMWFPPYNIQLNEVASAKYESTVMVGRNEPMYNYMNSERSAVLTFSLLVDYPEQLRNSKLQGQNKNKAIADFFAFGGDPLPEDYQIEIIEKKIEELRQQIPEISGPEEQAQPADISAKAVTIFFPNDMPTADDVNDIINTMYNDMHYEIINGLESANDGNGFGLNDEIYFIENITGSSENNNLGISSILPLSDQYTAIGKNNTYDNSISLLNQNLLDVFSNPDTRQYYGIEISGGASKLYLSANEKAYNEALGNRRIAATKQLILRKLATMFGETVAKGINIISLPSTGSIGNSAAGAEAKNMHEKIVKQERQATITIKKNTVGILPKEQKLNVEQQKNINLIKQDIANLELQLSTLKDKIRENIYNERNKAILNSFESISTNQFYPVFHSQTPEDFHRRLTFLQQCTRQGAAKRYDIVDENTGELRARNSVFGKQPICILRVGDFWYTKVIIETVTIDYADTTWDMNPEGFGMQPMMANITLNMKVIGGQSLKGPIDALQNAVSFNYYANSTFTDKNVYAKSSKEASDQMKFMFGIDGNSGIVGGKNKGLNDAYDVLTNKVTEGDK